MKQRPSTISVVVAAVRPSSMVPPPTVSTKKNEHRADGDADPPAPRRRRAPGQPAAAVTSSLGASARTGDGIPIVISAATVRCRGRNGKVKPRTDVRDQDGRVDGLRQVQPAEAVDVARDPPALPTALGSIEADP